MDIYWVCESCGFCAHRDDHVSMCPECGGEFVPPAEECYEDDEPYDP